MLRIARIALPLLAMACSRAAPPGPPAPRPVGVAEAAVDAAAA